MTSPRVVQVVESPWAAERVGAAQAFLVALPAATEVLIVAASRDAADDLARAVTREGGATFGFHRYSLTQLAARLALAELGRRGLAPSSALGTEAIAARVSFEALEQGALRYFAPVARFPGFARALAATLSELRSAGVSPLAFESLGGAAGDVAELLRRFEEQLDGGAVSDPTGLLTIAARAAQEGGLALHQSPVILLDVPIDSWAREIFVAALTSRAPSVLITVAAGDETTLRAVSALLARPRADEGIMSSGAASPRPAALVEPASAHPGGAGVTAHSPRRLDPAGEEPARPPLEPDRSSSDGRPEGNSSGLQTAPGLSADSRATTPATGSGAGGCSQGLGGGARATPPTPQSIAPELERLRTYLFSDASPPETPSAGHVHLFSAPGEGREAVEIARHILREARDGTPFDRMAVLLRAPEVYSALLETALARAGVPAFFARGTRRPDPAGRAFLALLDCAIDRLSARRFAEYLSLGQVPDLKPDGTPPTGRPMWAAPEDEALAPAVDSPPEADPAPAAWDGPDDSDGQPVVDGDLRAPWRWEALLVESAVIGGRDRWDRRLSGLAAELWLRLEELGQEEPDSPRLRALERDLRNLQHLRQFALPVIDRLSALPTSTAWGGWVPALEALAPMVLRRPERVLAVLADLRALAPIGPVTLDEVREVLAEKLTSLSEHPPAHRYGRVFVGTIEQARGRAFDIVFLPGLAERIFPQKPREDPILLDALRERLSTHALAQDVSATEGGLGLLGHLRRQGDRGQRERLLLRLAVGAAIRRLYLSYSRIDLAEVRPRVASFYALEVRRALAGRIPDPATMELDAAAAGRARLAWPAPADPRLAIDEVEHDLSTLGALLQGAPAETRGRARYLLELNDCLARSLRTRWARWMSPRWSPADGIVRLTDRTRAAIDGARLVSRAYSVSSLQRFAACPYRFFLSAICRLEPRTEIAPLERLDPLTRGKIFHHVQAEFLRVLQAASQLPVSRATLAAAMVTLDETIARIETRYREELAPAVDRVWRAEVEAVRVDLRMWLERSVEIQAAWEPLAFELAFGLPSAPEFDSRSVAREVVLPGGLRLRGVVDLVEQRRGSRELRVTDYKTGRNPTKTGLVVGAGEILQPVLYGLAVEDVMAGPVTEARLFFCTRAGEFSDRVVELSPAARRRGLDVLEVIDGAISRGFLPAAPRAKACEWCDFRDICGPHEERRTAQKDRGPLKGLEELRQWP